MVSDIPSNSGYRPDIDGLRAIAVVSVIIFHINATVLPGGFVGVDVFFVISGYLISRNLLSDVEANRFSLFRFYGRRIKRIAPALLVVTAATLLVSQLVLLPSDAWAAAKSAVFSLASLANVYFWLYQDTSYFAADSRQLPFLQLWSLGVEEQFYLLWPLVLAVGYRSSRRLPFLVGVIVVALVSFALGEYLFPRAPSFAYYMLPTRAGELMIGALVAVSSIGGLNSRLFDLPLGRASRGLFAWLGLAAIGASLLLLSKDDVFPGLRAIPPTVGTALVILAGDGALGSATRLLSVRPVVWVGVVSYSAYLWHWPLLAFLRYGHPAFDLLPGLGIFILIMALAWASYRFIEQPCRYVRWSFWKVLALQYVLPAGALSLVGIAAVRLGGYGLRYRDASYRETLASMQEQVLPPFHFDFVCQRQRVTPDTLQDPACIVGAADGGSPRVILWGDSNASHYVGVVAAFAEAAGFRFRNVEVGACPALDSDPASYVEAARVADCRASLTLIRPVAEEFSVVMLAASWTRYDPRKAFLAEVESITRRLAREGKQVILLGKVPEIPGYDRQCRQKALRYPGLKCPSWTSPVMKDIAAVNGELRRFADELPNVSYFDVTSWLCPTGICSAFDANGQALYYDPRHLTMEASLALGRKIVASEGVPRVFLRIVDDENTSQAAPP